MINPNQISGSKTRCRHGFSLVELLVTITIIIVLAALAFTITRKVRTQAQQANAVSAMRQIGIANVAYYTENNGNINVVRDKGEWGTWEGPGSRYATNSFIGRMAPHLFSLTATNDEKKFATEVKSSLNALFNTTDPKTMKGTLFDGVPVTSDGSGFSNPIAVNLSLRPKWGVDRAPLRVSSFGDHSNTLYLTYGRYYFTEEIGSKYLPLPRLGDTRRAIYFLPNRQGIFCFLDGHIDLLSPPLNERHFPKPGV